MLIIAIGVGWAVIGEPKKDIANWFWPSDAAPWESVDLYFYPDRRNLEHFDRITGLKNVEACQRMVNVVHARYPSVPWSNVDYECAIEQIDTLVTIPVYRVTTR